MSKSILEEYDAAHRGVENAHDKTRRLETRMREAAVPIARAIARYRMICHPHREDERWLPAEINADNIKLVTDRCYLGIWDNYDHEWAYSEYMEGGEDKEDWGAVWFPQSWLADDSWRTPLIARCRLRRQERHAERRKERYYQEQSNWTSYLEYKAMYEGEASVAHLPKRSPHLPTGGWEPNEDDC